MNPPPEVAFPSGEGGTPSGVTDEGNQPKSEKKDLPQRQNRAAVFFSPKGPQTLLGLGTGGRRKVA